jgi:hypothetical protein
MRYVLSPMTMFTGINSSGIWFIFFRLLVVSYRPSAFSGQLSAVSYQISDLGFGTGFTSFRFMIFRFGR